MEETLSSADKVRLRPKSTDDSQLLKDENFSLKKRLKCIHLLEQLLKDRDKSMNHLEKTVKSYKMCIEHLQWRLHKHNLDSSVDLKEHEIFEPGHDKQILKSLLDDAIRYKRLLDENYSSEEVAEAKETISALEEEVCKLCVQLKQQQKELADVLTGITSSDDEKDAIIGKLKCQLQEYCEQRTDEDAVRDMLSSEIRKIKSNTEKLVAEKKNITKELKEYAQREKCWVKERKMFVDHARILDSESNLGLQDQCKTLQEQVRNLSLENTDLCKQLKEVISMNTRWQKYSDQKDARFVQLTQQVNTLSENKEELVKKVSILEWLQNQKEIQRKQEIETAVLSLRTDLRKAWELNERLSIHNNRLNEIIGQYNEKEQLLPAASLAKRFSQCHLADFNATDAHEFSELVGNQVGGAGGGDDDDDEAVADGSLDEYNKDELLHCPCCLKEFSLMEHAQLVDHMDICNGEVNDDDF